MAHAKITKQIVDDELYLYINGVLVYKRWMTQGIGRVFHNGEGIKERIHDELKRETK